MSERSDSKASSTKKDYSKYGKGQSLIGLSPIEFECVARDLIFRHFVKTAWGKELEVHHRKKYQGKSGQVHEIDLSFELDLEGLRVLIFVECKCYQRNIGLDDLLAFSSRLDDVGAHKGIVISTVGYQKGAIKFADSNGIALLIAHAAEVPVDIILPFGGYWGIKHLNTHFEGSDIRLELNEDRILTVWKTVPDVYKRIYPLGSSEAMDIENFEVIFSVASRWWLDKAT